MNGGEYMTFGSRLKYFRNEKKMSQQDLAKQLNVTPQTISKWENNISEPEFQLINKITDIFKISYDQLFIDHSGDDYKGIIYVVEKDMRMKNIYGFFVGFCAFLSLSLLITTIYLSTLEELGWQFIVFFGLFTVMCLFMLFVNTSWRNIFQKSPEVLIEIYKDNIHIVEDNITIDVDSIMKYKLEKYHFYSGIRVYNETGLLKIWCQKNQKIVVRDILNINEVKKAMYQMKSKNHKEEQQ